MITIKSDGSFNKTEKFLRRMSKLDILRILKSYGQYGVNALSHATPLSTGETANSWFYTIEHKAGSYSITWHNRHIVDGNPIAILLQYGHATRNGGYVQGRDYINPAIRPIFDKIAEETWKVVTTT